MRTLEHTEFVLLLATADVSQASFARLSGVSARQVNKWCRGRAALPRWAALLAIALQELSAEALTIALEELLVAGRASARRNSTS
jgi:transcriptional regulator with XRE-family HTH domain